MNSKHKNLEIYADLLLGIRKHKKPAPKKKKIDMRREFAKARGLLDEEKRRDQFIRSI